MRALWIVPISFGCAVVACGGSSSETPWPIEPIDVEPGPQGEEPPTGDATDIGPAPMPLAEGDAGAAADEDESEHEDEDEEDEGE